MNTKPIVTCELIELDAVGGYPIGTYRAIVRRTSPHPVLGVDKPTSVTITSQVVRVDFDHRIIETRNTYYKY